MSLSDPTHRTYSFGGFTLDIDRGALRKAGVDIKLRPKSFEVLTYLLERHGTLAEKHALIDAIWGHTAVTDDALTQCLIEIRRALDDSDKSMIRTVPRRGYIFDVAVTYFAGDSTDQDSAGYSARKNNWIASSMLTAIVLASLYWWFAHPDGQSQPRVETNPKYSLAVMPFTDMSAAHDQQYFADGMAEDILNLLARIPQLQVTSRTSAFSFRGKNVDIPTVADQLNVANILEGSVRKDGNTMRITVQLIDTQSDTHIWSETFDRQLDDIFSVQDEIASKVIEALKVALLTEPVKTNPVDAHAYTAMLQARYLLNKYDPKYLPQIESLLGQALEISPDYVMALTELARLYQHQGSNGLRTHEEVVELFHETIGRAYELEPDNGIVHVYLGFAPLMHENDLRTGAPHIVKAMQLDPTNLFIVQWAQRYALMIGRFDVAKALGNYVVTRNPLCRQCLGDLGAAYLAAGDFDAAEDRFETIVLLDADSRWPGHYHVGLTRLLADDALAAVLEFEKENLEIFKNYGLALAYHELGQTSKFDSAFDSLRAEGDFYANASVYAWIGSVDVAFEWLEKGLQEEKLDKMWLETYRDPLFRNLHDDPRWDEFLERTGTSPAQLASIDFDISLPQ